MSAPVASGWSGRRVGLAPTGKAPPCHGAPPLRSFAFVDEGKAVRFCDRVASTRYRLCSNRVSFYIAVDGILHKDPMRDSFETALANNDLRKLRLSRICRPARRQALVTGDNQDPRGQAGNPSCVTCPRKNIS